MSTVPPWRLAGDWFDICSCNIPCPCEFAQAPTNNACAGMLAWHVRQGHYGDVRLDSTEVRYTFSPGLSDCLTAWSPERADECGGPASMPAFRTRSISAYGARA